MLNDAEIMEFHKETTAAVVAEASGSDVCASCKHWKQMKPCKVNVGPRSGPNDYSPQVIWEGECKKNPPSPSQDGYAKSQFPRTDYSCHCSQFEG